MIHAIVSFIVMFFEVLGAWLKSEIGAADYHIVRLVFFCTFAALFALHLRNGVWGIMYRTARVVVFYTPCYPELLLILGFIEREAYDRYSYRVFRAIWRVARPGLGAASGWATRQCQYLFIPKQNDNKDLGKWGSNDYT